MYPVSRELALSELRQTTVGYTYFTKQGTVPGPTTHWGKALAALAQIGDEVNQKVTLTIPAQPLTGTVTITANPSPAGQTTSVKFYVDGVPQGSPDTSQPFSFNWDTTTVSDSTHSIRADAFFSGNKTATVQQNVTVTNNVPPPPPPPQQPPANIAPPTITGTATEGRVLTVNRGSWTNNPTNYSQQWLRCDSSGNNPVAIAAATGTTYTLTSTDVGSTIRVTVIAYNTAGPSPAITSAQTGVVASASAGVPVNTAPPSVSGSLTQGSTLVSGSGSWTNNPTSYAYQWKRCSPSSLKIGEQAIVSDDDSGNGSLLCCQSATLSASATVQNLNFYVVSPAGLLRLGIYDDAGGYPGTLKAATAEFTPTTGWNTQVVTSPVSLSAGTYWLAYLPSSSSLVARKVADGTSSIKSYAYPYAALPSTFSTTFNSDGNHFSFYASLSANAACTDISGATTNQYILTANDVGKSMKSQVIAHNGSGDSLAALSAETAVVIGSQPPPPPPNGYVNETWGDISDPPWSSVQSFDTPGGADGPGSSGYTSSPQGRISVGAAPDGIGRALRLEIRNSDPQWPAGTDSVDRSQLQMNTDVLWNGQMTLGDIRYVDVGLWIPSEYDFVRNAWNALIGFHPNSGGWGCFNIVVENQGNANAFMQFKLAGGSPEGNTSYLRYINLIRLTNADGSQANRNRRIHLRYGARFAPDNTGWSEAWVDGVNVYPRTNGPTMWAGDYNVYLKLGPYKDHAPQYPSGKTVIYVTDFSVGYT